MIVDNYTTLLFDIDDTLLDFKTAQKQAFKKLLATVQLPFSETVFAHYQSVNHQLWQDYEHGKIAKDTLLKTRFAKFFADYQLNIDGIYADTLFRQFLTEGDQLLPHVHDVLATLSQTHTLAIVTNGIKETQLTRLTNNHLLPFFQKLFISEEMGTQKPEQAFFQIVQDTLQLDDLSQVLIIGDSFSADITGGAQFGIDTCWVNPQQLAIPTNSTIYPTYTINHVADLLQK